MPGNFDFIVGGVDIGGSKIAVGLATAIGRPLATEVLSNSPLEPLAAVADRVSAAILRLLASSGAKTDRLLGIGIGCPGPLDVRTGRVLQDPTLPGWAGHSVTEAFASRLGVPCAIENDADAALLGELFLGAAQGESDVAMLTVGNGVGGALWLEGALVRGTQAEHPEVGHVPVLPAGPVCYCGQRGCLEAVAGGAFLNRYAQAIGIPDAVGLFEQDAAGHAPARQLVDRAAAGIATAVAILVHTAAPRTILLGGGIIEKHYDRLAGPAQALLAELTLIKHLKISLRPAALGNKAGLLGACRIGLDAGGRSPRKYLARRHSA